MTKHDNDLPQVGWTFHEICDAATMDPKAAVHCEFCGRRLRWIHLLKHAGHPTFVAVGNCCAARLCYGYDAQATEREFRNRTERQARFVDPQRWKRSRNNPQNICRTVIVPSGRLCVTVFLKDGRYGVCFGCKVNRRTRDAQFMPEMVGSQAEAKHMAFEAIDAMKHADDDAPSSPDETT